MLNSFNKMLKNYWKIKKNYWKSHGKVREICQSKTVGTMGLPGSTTNLPFCISRVMHVVHVFCLAVVTGCTRGIGEAMSDELAEYGLNIVLVSRNRDSLRNVAADLGIFLTYFHPSETVRHTIQNTQ